MGFGSDWGSGPYGDHDGELGDVSAPLNNFVSPIYQTSFGVVLGRIPFSQFTGEPESGPLSGFNGAIFISPALLEQNNTNQIDINEISISSISSDAYEIPVEKEFRVFTFGPNSDARTNDTTYGSQPKVYAAVATLVQTTPPGPTTVINIP